MDEETRVLVPQGTCTYCGQSQTVYECYTQVDADNRASKECDCPGAKEARSEMDAGTRREQTLSNARRDIADLFGDPADERGEIAVENDVCGIFYTLAEMVYNEQLRGVSITITQGVRAKISKTDKGKLTIQRDDSSSRKKEYKD